jgi:hypothetical protein
MKNYFLTILFGILLLVACTPTITSTPVAIKPTDIPIEIPTQIPTSTPLPQGKTIIVTSDSDSGPGNLRQALTFCTALNNKSLQKMRTETSSFMVYWRRITR